MRRDPFPALAALVVLALLAAIFTVAHADVVLQPRTPQDWGYPAPTLTVAQGATIDVTWAAPSQNEDGSPITGALTYEVEVCPDATTDVGGLMQIEASGISGTSASFPASTAGVECLDVRALEPGTDSDTGDAIEVASPPSQVVCITVVGAGISMSAPAGTEHVTVTLSWPPL